MKKRNEVGVFYRFFVGYNWLNVKSSFYFGENMAPFVTLACSVATVISGVLAVQTGKNVVKTIKRRKRRHVRKVRSGD